VGANKHLNIIAIIVTYYARLLIRTILTQANFREIFMGINPPSVKPNFDACEEFLKNCRFGEEPSCIHCKTEDSNVIKKGRTQKGIQQFYCSECGRYFNLLTDTILAQHRLDLEEMFYIIDQLDDYPIGEIADELGRTYKTVLNFVHEVEDAPEPEADWYRIVRGQVADVEYSGPVPAAGSGVRFVSNSQE
jgi:transposase-like protein